MLWLLVSLCLLQSLSPQAPSRDAPSPRPGTATIRGRVTDKETGRPIMGVRVRMVGEVFVGNPISATTDDDGRYRLAGIPAGRHTILAMMPPHRTQYLAQVYGDDEPFDPARMGRSMSDTITIAASEVREGVDIRMSRALGISGRVVDEFGEPLSDVSVGLESALDGPVGIFSGPRATDDRGAFRLFGLRPGAYRVCATPDRSAGRDDANAEALQAACYPGDDDPMPLTLAGADPPDVEIRLRRGRTFTLSGTVVDATGAPVEDAHVRVITRSGRVRFSEGMRVTSGGRFSRSGLAPGDLSVVASVGNRYDPLDRRERQIGVTRLRIDSADADVIVPISRGGRVTGKVVVEGGMLPDRAKVAVSALMGEAIMSGLEGPAPAAPVGDALTFELDGLFGAVRFYCSGLPSGWIVKSIQYQERDITNVPMEFAAGSAQAIEIVLTNKGAIVSGRVVDTSGRPAPEAVSVLFLPADYAADWSPMIPTGRTKIDGTFQSPPLRAGEYLVAAVETMPLISLVNDGRMDRRRLARVAQRVTLSEGERRTLDLRLVKLPEER